MQQDALVAVDVGDLGFAGRSRHEAGIESENTLAGEAANINHVRAHSAGIDRQLDGGSALDDQLRFFVSHRWPPVLLYRKCDPPRRARITIKSKTRLSILRFSLSREISDRNQAKVLWKNRHARF